MYLDNDIINILWKAGCTNYEMIYKIININKLEKIKENNKLTEESRKFYMELDTCGYYCSNSYIQRGRENINNDEYWKSRYGVYFCSDSKSWSWVSSLRICNQ